MMQLALFHLTSSSGKINMQSKAFLCWCIHSYIHSSNFIVIKTLGKISTTSLTGSTVRKSFQLMLGFKKLERYHTVKCKLEWGFVFDLLFVSNLVPKKPELLINLY